MVGIPALFMNLNEVTDLTSIGTLFAFLLVCGGSLVLKKDDKENKATFNIIYLNSKYIFPLILLLSFSAAIYFNPDSVDRFFSSTDPSHPLNSGWEVLREKIPFAVFSSGMIFLSYFCFIKEYSLIPVLGLASCSYLMTELGMTNWIRFGIWLLLGGVVYRVYGFRHSRLQKIVKS
jgi:amino acid transporter